MSISPSSLQHNSTMSLKAQLDIATPALPPVPGEEKDAVLIEQITTETNGLTQEDNDFLATFPDEQKKKAVRKVGTRPVPLLIPYVASRQSKYR